METPPSTPQQVHALPEAPGAPRRRLTARRAHRPLRRDPVAPLSDLVDSVVHRLPFDPEPEDGRALLPACFGAPNAAYAEAAAAFRTHAASGEAPANAFTAEMAVAAGFAAAGLEDPGLRLVATPQCIALQNRVSSFVTTADLELRRNLTSTLTRERISVGEASSNAFEALHRFEINAALNRIRSVGPETLRRRETLGTRIPVHEPAAMLLRRELAPARALAAAQRLPGADFPTGADKKVARSTAGRLTPQGTDPAHVEAHPDARAFAERSARDTTLDVLETAGHALAHGMSEEAVSDGALRLLRQALLHPALSARSLDHEITALPEEGRTRVLDQHANDRRSIRRTLVSRSAAYENEYGGRVPAEAAVRRAVAPERPEAVSIATLRYAVARAALGDPVIL